MTTRPASASPKSSKPAVLGRSEATGRFVLRPASKAGALSVRAATTAVQNLRGDKKK